MATSRVLERREVQEPTLAATANLHSSLHKYSLLIIIGRTAHFGQTGHISREIQQGIRSWDIDFKSCNLNLCLQEFLSHHTASFKGAGQKCLRHGTRVLDTQVLISPSLQQVHSEVLALLSSESAHKLLILAGQSVEESGDLLFHNGRFSPHQLKQILTEQIGVSKKKHIEMDNIDLVHPASIGGYAKSVLLCNPLPLTLPALESLDQAGSASCPKLSLTLSCPGIGQWKKTLLGSQSLQDSNTLHINPPEVLPAMEALGEFTSLISNTLSTPSPFDLLPPPTTVGFLKLSRPCCYVFPAGRGDCAFFAVNGFTMLIDGGSDSQACFWKLVRHLDRVDAVLLTHVGTENLPGVNTFLERKAAEMDLSSDVKDDSSKRLISPELGVVFFNAPSGLQMEEQPYVDNVLKCTHQAALTVHLLKKLDINPQPLFRPQAVPTKPLTLFQKMGVGQLDLYILSPSKNSQEYQTFMQNWPDAVSSSASKSHTLPLTALTSVSALLVWHPACSQEKVVRVLFPGVTPQAKLLQGLEKLKGLVFLQKPTVTTGDLERHEEDIKTKRTDIQDSGRSQGKETATKPGKDWVGKENGKDIVGEENGKLLNGVTSDKIKIKEIGVKQKAASTERTTSKKGGRNSGKKEKTANREENSGIRRDLGKNDHRHPEPINENKTKHKKEARNYPKTGVKKNRKASGNEAINVKNVNAESLKINSAENSAGTKLKISEPEGLDKELQNQKTKKESEENACNSKTSTSEDAAADWLQQETASKVETADRSGNEESFENLKTEPRTEDGDAIKGNTAGKIVIMGGERGDNEEQHKTLFGEKVGPSQNAPKSAKVVGFPSPLNKTPKTKNSVELDLTPTEFTLLDGALRHTPPSRSSPDYQPPISPGEETVEPDTPDSRPNSAGNTPYCLSPDDVWCNRATLSRLQAQMSNSDPTDVNQPNGASKQSEGQPCQPKTTQESHTNPREKHLSFLPLSTFKDGTSDPSPSVATTTTTHSMPAEVSSPQSTEVDESLSMSLEQGPTTVSQKEGDESGLLLNTNGSHYMGMSAPVRKPPRSLGQTSEMWRPPAPNTFNFEASAHEVDLCLVSPCEFKHFKPTDSSVSEPFAPHEHGDHETKDTSPSESNPPICMEDCTSTTADAALDSDEDESCSDPSNSPRDLCTSQALPKDPPPVQVRDSPPLAPHPGTSMPVPHSDSDDNRKRAKPVETRGKTSKAVTEAPHRSGSAKNRTGSQSGVTKGNVFCTRPPSSNARSAQAKSSPNAGFKPSSAGEVSVYVDLAYIPSGAASPTVNMDFFKSIHSSCYIVSGDSLEREELLRQTLDALLESKRSWPETMQVSVIPTFESVPMQEWYQQTLDRQKELGITVLGSNSTVAMQDETFPACKIEF